MDRRLHYSSPKLRIVIFYACLMVALLPKSSKAMTQKVLFPKVEQRAIASLFPQTRHGCSGENRTIYLRAEGFKMIGTPPPIKVSRGLSLQECAQRCTENGAQCRSFEYDSEQLLCELKEEDSRPFGLSVLVKERTGRAGPDMFPSIAHFQAVCMPSDVPLCPSAHAFERFPQHVLIGNALEVRPVNGLSECLANCLQAKRQLRLDCRSVMFFYESGICMLNREHRTSVVPAMFREQSSGELVDYFEMVCVDVECSDEAELHWMRTEHYRVDPSRELLLEGVDFEQCRGFCKANQINGSAFPCKAFVFSTSSGECRLSADSGILSGSAINAKRKRMERESNGSGENVGSSNSAERLERVGGELSAFSAGQYHEKVCLPGRSDAVPRPNCADASASFELFPGKALNISKGEGQTKLLSTSTLAACLSACLANAAICRSAQFHKDIDECVLSPLSQLSHPQLFQPSPLIDYYDNLCAPPSEGAVRPSGGNTNMAFASPTLERPVERKARPVMMDHTAAEGEQQRESKVADWKRAVVETDCRLRGIQVAAKFPSPSSGKLFLRDHSANCTLHFRDTLVATLSLPYPAQESQCPGTELSTHFWSFVVVLQQSAGEAENGDLTLNSQLLTGNERTFNITCDFAGVLAKRSSKSSSPNSTSVDTALALSSASNLSSVPSLKLHMTLLRNGEPVTNVSLGEQLEMRWTMERTEKTGLGMFVESCVADRLGGIPPEPPPLVLIADGCPESRVRAAHLIGGPIRERPAAEGGFNTTLKVFRFDGSRRVRIRCTVNICVEKCPPINCSAEEHSYGKRRRKRNARHAEAEGKRSTALSTLEELAQLVEKYDRVGAPNEGMGQRAAQQNTTTTISGSYTISDGASHYEEVPQKPAKGTKRERTGHRRRGSNEEEEEQFEMLGNQRQRLREEQQSEELAVVGTRRGESGKLVPLLTPCGDAPVRTSRFCVSRSIVILAVLVCVTLGTLQCLQLARCLRKIYKRNGAQQECGGSGKSGAEQEHGQHPPAPSSPSMDSVECGFHRGDEQSHQHRTSALCVQNQCSRNPNWPSNGQRRHSSLSWADQQRALAKLQKSADQWAVRDVLSTFRPKPHPRRTVFPAEPTTLPNPARSMRRKAIEHV